MLQPEKCEGWGMSKVLWEKEIIGKKGAKKEKRPGRERAWRGLAIRTQTDLLKHASALHE